ncbi:uncharacterized protein [Littorina saxatilis]|uniref:uncharacterized protein n=1 Tax=Littorina saxatilis TaxID=31220 RepID=UPI0038B5E029
MQTKDESLKKCFEQVQEESQVTDQSKPYFIMKDGLLHRAFCEKTEVVFQVVVPTSLREQVLHTAHDALMSGHFGTRRTLKRILTQFFWPGVRRDVGKYCRTCDVCQKTSSKGRVPAAPLQKMPLIDVPFKKICIDLVGPFKPVSSTGFRYILTIVDTATRFPEAIPLKQIDTISVAEALFSVFSRMGCPQVIVSDCGTQFVSDLMMEIYRLLAIKSIHTSPYHAQANGLVERFNGTLKSMLQKVVQERPTDWDRYVPALLFAYRELPNVSTGFSPYELLFGRAPRGPMSILADSWTGRTDGDEAKPLYQYVFDLKNRIADTCALAQSNVRDAARIHKHYHDRKAKLRTFVPGDEVLVLLTADSNKLLMCWKGPFKVMEVVSPVDYRIDLNGKHKVFHVNMLKKYERRVLTAAVAVGRELRTGPVPDDQEFSTLMSDSDQKADACSDHVLDPVCAVAVLSPEIEDEVVLPTIPAVTGESVKDVHYSDDLSHSGRTELETVFQEFSELLTDKPGVTKDVDDHVIPLTSECPVYRKPYPLPFASRQTVEKEIKSMLDLGVIEPSKSAYSSPIVLVAKRDGSVRFCIDFRALNKITHFDAEPIPDPDELFCSLAGANFYTKIDLAKGYWQIPIKPEDRHKTAFQTPLGLFQWVKMPFGLVSAPATFARMMRKLNLAENSAVNFYDDILIATQTWSDHVKQVRAVLSKMLRFRLTARPSKLFAGFSELEFLGHVVGRGYLKPEDGKVKKILSVNRPTTKKQVRSLMGLLSYYRRYVPNFATLTAPLTDLTRDDHGKTITWTAECDSALKAVQEVLSTFPVLLLPDLSQDFVVRTDASSTGLGAVLLQEKEGLLHPVAYASRKLLDRESRYSTIERECLAIVWGLTKFSRYLLCREFVIQTDHRPLTYMASCRLKNSRVMRWVLSLQEFKFVVQPIAGQCNQFADLLSRSVCDQTL